MKFLPVVSMYRFDILDHRHGEYRDFFLLLPGDINFDGPMFHRALDILP